MMKEAVAGEKDGMFCNQFTKHSVYNKKVIVVLISNHYKELAQ